MAKRFTGTDKWDKAWFRKLNPRLKCFWQYLLDKCDQAGVWEVDFESATHFINDQAPITEEDLNFFGSRIERLKDNKIWIVGFVDFQCGELSEKCHAHKPVFKLLKKYSLLDRVLSRVYNTLQEIDIEIEEEKEIEIEKEKEKEGTENLFRYEVKSDSAKSVNELKISIQRKDEISEEIFNDEKFITDLQIVHEGKDIAKAWHECWLHFSGAPTPPEHTWQWKQKLNTWLINTKEDGSSKKRKQSNGRIQGYATRYGAGTGKT